MLKLYYFIVNSIPEKLKQSLYGFFGITSCEAANTITNNTIPMNFPLDEAVKILIQLIIGGITLYKLFKKRNDATETVLTKETELKK